MMSRTKSMQEIAQKAAEEIRKYMADYEANRQKFYERLYKQEPIEYKKCNFTSCRYNADGECTDYKLITVAINKNKS